MKVNIYIYTSLLTALLIGWGCLLSSCTDHSEMEQPYTGESEGEPLHIVGMTRTGDETSDSDPMQGQSVQLFLDDGVKTPIPSEAVTYHGKTTSSSDLFGNTTTLKVKPGADYYVFGFLPSNANAITEETNGNSSVTVNSETKIATMTIENLPSLSTKDVCVVIGAKGKLGTNEKVDVGSFKYHAPENTEEGFGVSLLVDHLFAAIDFNICVGATYNAVRTIKLKKVVMKSTSVKKVTAVITLKMNDNKDNPITNVAFTPSETAQEEMTLYQSEDVNGTALDVTTPISFTGFYGAGIKIDNTTSLGSTLSIESTYDIYDKDGNLIEANRKAVNNLATVLSNISRGKKVNLDLKVIPTYLYILSDNELDNPTIVVE